MTRSKPLFAYAGGKTKLLTTYYPFFQGLRPQHCVDYFGGSGGMSLWFHQLYPEAKLFLNEKDPAIYKLFMNIKMNYEEFSQHLRSLEEDNQREDRFEGKKEWYYFLRNVLYNVTQDIPVEWLEADAEAHPEDYEPVINFEKEFGCSFKGLSKRQIDNMFSLKYNGWTMKEWEEMSGQNTPLEHACYFFLRKLSFSGVNVRNKKGEYTSAAGIRSPNQPCYDPETLAAFKAMLEHTELLNKDYKDIDLQLPKSMHYFDPPYVGSDERLYVSHFNWEQTEEMCEYIQRLSEHHTVFMSNYDHPQLKKLMKGFAWYSFPAAGAMQRKRRKDPVRETLFYKIHPSIVG